MSEQRKKVFALNWTFCWNAGKLLQLGGWGLHSTHRGNILAFHPEALGKILGIPKNFSPDVDKINEFQISE